MADVHLRLTRGSNSILVDLFENDPINMNKLFSSVETFDIQGSYSQTFRVPMTENNQSFFGALYDPTDNSFDLRTKIDAELSCDTIPIYTGYCQVKKMITKAEITHELELAFFATTPNIKSAIADKKIKDITDLPNLNHSMVIANVTTPPANVLWSLIERGQKFSESGELGTRRVFDINSPLFVGDLTPSVNALYIWKQIFDDAGFTYESDFIDNTLVDYWIPFSNAQFIATEQAADNIGFGIFRSTDFTFNAIANQATLLNSTNSFNETYDNGGTVSGGQFTAPYYAYYTFKVHATWKKTSIPTGQTAAMHFRFYDQSTGLPIASINNASMSGYITQSDTFFTYEYVRTYLLNVGDTIEHVFYL